MDHGEHNYLFGDDESLGQPKRPRSAMSTLSEISDLQEKQATLYTPAFGLYTSGSPHQRPALAKRQSLPIADSAQVFMAVRSPMAIRMGASPRPVQPELFGGWQGPGGSPDLGVGDGKGAWGGSTLLSALRRGLLYIVVLLFASSLTIGSYFAYDAAGALAPQIKKQLGISDSQFEALYYLYSIPNILMVWVGGWLTDRLRARWANLLFTLLCVAGSGLVTLAVYLRQYYLLLFGRFIFGIGAESLSVSQNCIITEWFADSRLSFALGISLFVSRLGTFATFSSEAALGKAYGVTVALGVACGLCAVSFVCGFVLLALDLYGERSGYKARRDEAARGPQPSILYVRHFPAEYFFIALLVGLLYSAVFPFAGNGPLILESRFHYTSTRAGQVTSIIILMSMLLSPLMGLFVDRVGMRAYINILGAGLLMVGHGLLVFTRVSPLVSIVCIGAALSAVPASLWPSVPLLIKPKYHGLAFGLMTAFQNFMLAFSYILISMLTARAPAGPGKFEYTLIYFLVISTIGMVGSLVLTVLQRVRMGNRLNLGLAAVRRQDMEKLEAGQALSSESISLSASISEDGPMTIL